MAVAADIENKVNTFLKLVSTKINISHAYLFGSAAKDNRHAWSDIDLAIVSPAFSGDNFEDNKLLIPFILEVDHSIEVHPFRPHDFTPDNPFVNEIMKTGIHIL